VRQRRKIESIPNGERVLIGADFNGHFGEGNMGYEYVMGKFRFESRNPEEQIIINLANRMNV